MHGPRSRSVLTAAIALAATALAPLPAQRVSADGPAVSPFRGMRLVEGGIEVQVTDDTWYALVSIEAVDTATLLRESQRRCGDRWWKRVTEDLPALLDAIGTRVGRDVDLELEDLGTGEPVTLANVRMTHENRQRLRDAHRGRVPAGFAAAATARSDLAAADAARDLAELRALLDSRFSYRHLRDVDLDALIEAAIERLGQGAVERATLAREVDAILAAFGDGHSRVTGGEPYAGAWLPFLIQRVEGGYAAFLADRSALVDPDHPFVDAIDGVPLERWLEQSRQRACRGAAAMQLKDTERGLRELDGLRAALDLPRGPRVAVTLRGAGGARELELPVAARKPIYGAWPHQPTRLLDGGVGYLRIPQMTDDPDFLADIDAAMRRFRDCPGLVIDVRGNGGGTRDVLRRLFPYFLGADEPPQVVNVAVVLRAAAPDGAHGGLADRSMFPADYSGWSANKQRAARAFAAEFRPTWAPDAGRFSERHYLVLDQTDNPTAFAFAGKVAVLMDRACFSATDIFLAALQTRPQVTLVGEPSSGGSGRAQPYRLPNSGIRLQLSSMVSYRPDGALFEGNGVEPDVAVEPAPGDLVRGGGDAALLRALEVLRR